MSTKRPRLKVSNPSSLPRAWAPRPLVDWWESSEAQQERRAVLLKLITDERMRPAWEAMKRKRPRDGWEIRIAHAAVLFAPYAALPTETPGERRDRLKRAANLLYKAAAELFRTIHDLPLAHFLGQDYKPSDPRLKRLSVAITDAAGQVRNDAESMDVTNSRRMKKAIPRTFAEAMKPFFQQEFGDVLAGPLATMTTVVTDEEYSRSAVLELP